MDGIKLQAKIYSGYAKAAQRIGWDTGLYRPTTAANPLAPVNKQQSIRASFNAEDMGYRKPNKYGHPTWWGLFDGRLTKVGDYLTNDSDGTFFVAAQQQALPILCVSCNTVVDVLRPQQQAGVGALGYGGNIDSTETPLMQQWPASVLQSGSGEKADSILPGDVKTPSFSVLLPRFQSVVIRTGDIIKDNLERRFIVRSAELTDLGWRLMAQQAQT